jgi:uncharacterized membrane protein (UPF0136 family)
MYVITLLFTVLLLVGSFMGYYKAGSVASLVMGLVFTFLLTSFTLLYRKGRQWAGQALLLSVLALDTFFCWRYIKTQALFPGGFFVILTSILLVIIYLHIKKRS